MVIKNNKGFSMPLVLMIVVVVSLLGATIMQVSTSDTMQAQLSVKKMQAYYLARSGADATAAYLINNPAMVSKLLDDPRHPKFSPANLSDGTINYGTYTVDITGDKNKVTITSKAYVEGVPAQTVTLNLVKLSATDIFSAFIYSKQLPDVKEVHISGGGIIQSAEDFILNSYDEKLQFPRTPRDFPPIVFPALTLLLEPINVSNKQTRTLNSSDQYEYPSIEVDNGGTLIINTRDNDGKITDLNIMTDSLTSYGSIQVKGGGTLHLYVSDSGTVDIQTNGSLTTDDNTNLVVLLGKGSTFTDQASMVFNGYIYGPEASSIVQSDKTQFTGAIIADNFSAGGSCTLIFKPISDSVDIGIVIYKRGNWSS